MSDNGNRRSTTLIVGMVGFFIFLAGLSISLAVAANGKASNVEAEFRSHSAAQVSDMRHLHESLDRIEKGQENNRKLLDQILRDGRDH